MKKLNQIVLIALILSGTLVGCSSIGSQSLKDGSSVFDGNLVFIANQLHIGKTTKEQVLTLLGLPNDVGFIGDGLEVMKYEYQRSKPRLRNFTPLAIFSLTSDVTVKQVVILLNKNSTVKNVIVNDSVIQKSFGIME